MFVEMAQMASRPFGCVQLELPKDIIKSGGKVSHHDLNCQLFSPSS